MGPAWAPPGPRPGPAPTHSPWAASAAHWAADAAQWATLVKLTERYCVVLQRLAGRPELSVECRAG